MAYTEILRKCPKCGGAGIYYKDSPTGQTLINPCPQCDGNEYINIALIDIDDLQDKLDTVTAKCDEILTAIDGIGPPWN